MLGKELKAERVIKVRLEEIDEFSKHEVYRKVPREECMRNTAKTPIRNRWLDVNKGDETNPKYRSRLVVQEMKQDKREDLCAATPPLEAK